MTQIRNVAIIAHVDHGKTTLVDQMLKQTNIFREGQEVRDCFLDSNDIERERGITILSKNISIEYKRHKINVIDTPGHSDFGGQVERVLNLANGVLLLVDAAEGPMPQTRFVLDKALGLGLKPVVVINKVDKQDARPDEILDKVFDLFVELDATDEQLDFTHLYGSGRDGWVSYQNDNDKSAGMIPLLDVILKDIPPPPINRGPIQLQVTSIEYSEYVGKIAVGRVHRGTLDKTASLTLLKQDGTKSPATVKQLFEYEGLGKKEVMSVQCGDICAVVGLENLDIGDTLADSANPELMPPISMDEPTISMLFRVNNSPLYGQEGKYVSSRHLRERLLLEAEKDVALGVVEKDGEAFEVKGRGVMHISILIETMRREGYEMSVSRPHVIYKTVNGERQEPFEILSVDTPDISAGKVIELVGIRRGEMISMDPYGNRQIIEFHIPTRGIIGLRSKIMTASAGEAIVSHLFSHYGPCKGDIPQRQNGVLISMGQGDAIAYAIDALQLRGRFVVEPNEKVYEGMIVAEHCRDGDLTVNLQKGKQLTNVRASGSDKAMKIAPAIKRSLEETLEYIADDELVEVTPKSIRMRKLFLTELERKRNRSLFTME